MATKFTFKTEKPTGRYRSFYPYSHYIKLDKKEVGRIYDEYPHKITLAVKDESEKCGFRWITLKKESASIQEAKDFLNGMFDTINQKYSLHKFN